MHNKLLKRNTPVCCIIAIACLALPIESTAICDNTTLSGSYHFQDLWVAVQEPDCRLTPPDIITCRPVPTTTTTKGVVLFDGAGGAVFDLRTRHVDGGPPRYDIVSGAGTYAVAVDCSVTLTVPTGESFLFLTTPSGNFIYELDPFDGLRPNENFIGMALRD